MKHFFWGLFKILIVIPIFVTCILISICDVICEIGNRGYWQDNWYCNSLWNWYLKLGRS